MRKAKKFMLFIICFILCFTGTTIFANAADYGVQPYYDYTMQTSSNLHIDSNGKANVTISCMGYSGVTKITSETCLQRRFGLIWIKADIGTTNNVWTYTVYKDLLAVNHSTNLSKKGTYRAKTVFTVYKGSNYEKITVYSLNDEY